MVDRCNIACGCILGGAMGDALGYNVEFLSYKEILEKYPQGIQEFELEKGWAIISDDTQMTLYTLEALLYQKDNLMTTFYDYYLDWMWTQLLSINSKISLLHPSVSKLPYIEEMRYSRAPGNTCVNSLLSGKMGTLEAPLNHSKGCGGLMRVSPIGVYYGYRSTLSIIEIASMAIDNTLITHGHELGYIPSFCLVDIIARIMRTPERELKILIEEALKDTKEYFHTSAYIDEFMSLMNKAIAFSKMQKVNDIDYIRQLGEGWVAEETLAIGIYCALKYQHDFKQAIISSVNHDGDSDSTGAVTGNVLGAYMGLDKLPKDWLDKIELNDLMIDLASQTVGIERPSFYQFIHK